MSLWSLCCWSVDVYDVILERQHHYFTLGWIMSGVWKLLVICVVLTGHSLIARFLLAHCRHARRRSHSQPRVHLVPNPELLTVPLSAKSYENHRLHNTAAFSGDGKVEHNGDIRDVDLLRIVELGWITGRLLDTTPFKRICFIIFIFDVWEFSYVMCIGAIHLIWIIVSFSPREPDSAHTVMFDLNLHHFLYSLHDFWELQVPHTLWNNHKISSKISVMSHFTLDDQSKRQHAHVLFRPIHM